MRLAVLDVGSNTVHLVVVDGQPDGTFAPVARERETLRLAEAAFPAMLLPDEAVERLTATVARMRAIADELRADALVGFATSAIREARNGIEALGRVRESTGVSVAVLPGVEEARLTYLAGTTARQRSRLPGLDALRAGNAVAGSQVAALVMQAFGLRQLVLAPWAMREGVILDYLARHDPRPAPGSTDDPRRRRAVLDFARRHAWDEPHCRQVTALALSLFDQTAGLHGLDRRERELLETAGLLHDVGYAVAQSAHHKHSLYLIRNADLDGFSLRERDLVANIARYHRKALPTDRHAEYMALDDDDRLLVRKLAALLRVADGLDADHFQVVEAATVVDQGDLVRLELRARDVPDLDMWAAERNGDLFELEFGRRIEPVAVEVV